MPLVPRKVAIIGAGLSGLSAAIRLSEMEDPPEIHLFESLAHLGGRASSNWFPDEKLLLDSAQHVTMNCCTEMLQFLLKTDLLRFWKLQPEMTFCVRQTGKKSGKLAFYPLRNSRVLPKPFHLLPSLWGLKFLTPVERFELLGILRQIRHGSAPPGTSFREWLEELFCPHRVAELYFGPVILSAFSDQMESVSAQIAQSVFRQIFCGPRDAWQMWVPKVPLREIFDSALTPTLEKRGILIHRQTSVKRLFADRLVLSTSETDAQTEFSFDAAILAVPWHRAGKILPELVTQKTFTPDVFEPRTIASVHFFADRDLFPQENLVFPSETIQWLFKVPFLREEHGFQALLSDSDRCVSTSSGAIEQIVHAELQMLFPEATFNRFRVTRVPAAVFSCNAWMEHARPTVLTPFPTVFLAGDWTSTGLPATMESAVRSGSKAAEETRFFLENLPENAPKRA
ncbi:MAG: FAD-dependent oxidoreductase [Thermoguttaceae bacterium]|nr:FAD-dependent oxidoreductase [Thermoguttaceae bacterium]